MEQQQRFLVETRRGNYNLLNSKDVDVSVRVLRPGHEPFAFTVSENYLSELPSWQQWSEYVQEACETYLRRYWVSSHHDKVKALLEWVKDEGNARALDTAWAEQKVEGLKAQLARVQAELAAAERSLAEMSPRVFKDGDQWCALSGPDLQEGTAGFGITPAQALAAFEQAEAHGE